MRNFLALLGWSPGEDREILPEPQMIELFSLEGIQKKPAVFDTTKLEWMNGQYLSALPATDLVGPVREHLGEMGLAGGDRDLLPLIDAVKARSRTLIDIARQVAVRIDGSQVTRDAKGEQLVAKMGVAFGQNLGLVVEALSNIDADGWTAEHRVAALKSAAETHGRKLGDIMQPVRVVLTGSTVSEPVNELLAVVGRDQSLARLRAAAA